MSIQSSGLDGLAQELLLNAQLHGKRPVHEIGVCPRVDKYRDCGSLSVAEKLSVDKGPRGLFSNGSVAHQRPLSLCRVLPSCIGSVGAFRLLVNDAKGTSEGYAVPSASMEEDGFMSHLRPWRRLGSRPICVCQGWQTDRREPKSYDNEAEKELAEFLVY
ncbi:unnamed protein product [Pleuronectes platessa]|uniref:Uncharacterized protein n=1 Tax=Pleuronectes platessa TaxID=8262 RepID=A0A9N7VNL8_PLEPL|nr:unnamed protein product [Pleuronectes platessa]